MDTLFIFGAQYLWVLSPLLALWYFLKLPKEERKEFLICSCFILPTAFLLGLLAKQLWLNPSPLNPGENGFPSDHTLLVATLATLIMLFNKKMSVWLWIIVAVVASSRVYVGEHHLVDVIGSVVIALISAGIAYAIIRHIGNHNKTQSS